MKGDKAHNRLRTELLTLLGDRFPGLTVDVGVNPRWKRTCVTFRWPGFADLLPEERFHRLAAVIPEAFRESKMAGVVWLEIAPDETVDQFLKLPRSEDMTDKEPRIYKKLKTTGFFRSLGESLGSSPKRTCPGDFSRTIDILATKAESKVKIREAKLIFIRHGAFCDCQVLQAVEPALAKSHAAAS